jgi:hypothetical protein
MKSTRTCLSTLAFLAFIAFGTLAAQAAIFCGDICDCSVPCSTRCTEGPGLPTLTCGQWTYEPCVDKPWCAAFSASSSARTSDASGKANLLLKGIFSPAPAAAPLNR